MTNIAIIDYVTNTLKKAVSSAKYRASKRGLDFDINYNYLRDLLIKQECKCFYSGIKFRPNDRIYGISVDRIDNSRGYTKDNVVLCLTYVNFLKSDKNYSEIIKIITKLATNIPEWTIKVED